MLKLSKVNQPIRQSKYYNNIKVTFTLLCSKCTALAIHFNSLYGIFNLKKVIDFIIWDCVEYVFHTFKIVIC